jgi:thiol-disulfide isomerase/thioredoxin
MATTRSFCLSVLLPLATLLALLLLTGCRPTPAAPLPTPVAPCPTPDQPNPPNQKHDICCPPQIWAFGADWCPACCAGHEKLAAMEKMGVEVTRINIDQHPDLAAKYAITSIPVYYVLRCGHETVRTQDIDEAVRLMNELYAGR